MRKILVFLVLGISFFLCINSTSARVFNDGFIVGDSLILLDDETDYSVVDTNVEDICASRNYRVPMRFLGITLNFVKIAVPVLIILFGLIDLYKAVTASKDDAIKKAVRSIALRVVAGVFVFLLPGLVQFALNLVQEWSDYQVNWCCCTECLLNGDCNVNIDSCSNSCSIGGMSN